MWKKEIKKERKKEGESGRERERERGGERDPSEWDTEFYFYIHWKKLLSLYKLIVMQSYNSVNKFAKRNITKCIAKFLIKL